MGFVIEAVGLVYQVMKIVTSEHLGLNRNVASIAIFISALPNIYCLVVVVSAVGYSHR